MFSRWGEAPKQPKYFIVLFRTTSAQVTLEEANAMLAEFDTDIVMEDGDDTGRGNIMFLFSKFVIFVKILKWPVV